MDTKDKIIAISDYISEFDGEDKYKLLQWLGDIELEITDFKDRIHRKNMIIKDRNRKIEQLRKEHQQYMKEVKRLYNS